MFDDDVVIGGLAIGPVVHIRAKAGAEGADGGLKTLTYELVSPGERVRTIAAIWSKQAVDEWGDNNTRKGFLESGRDVRVPKLLPQLALPGRIDSGGNRVLIQHEVPGVQRIERRLDERVFCPVLVQRSQKRQQQARRNRVFIALKLHHLAGRQVFARSKHFLNPGKPVRLQPVIADRIGIVGRQVLLVCGGDKSLRGIQDVRQLANRQIAIPLKASIPRHRHQAVPVGPERHNADRLPADIALSVRPDHIL